MLYLLQDFSNKIETQQDKKKGTNGDFFFLTDFYKAWLSSNGKFVHESWSISDSVGVVVK